MRIANLSGRLSLVRGDTRSTWPRRPGGASVPRFRK